MIGYNSGFFGFIGKLHAGPKGEFLKSFPCSAWERNSPWFLRRRNINQR
jgi:hypothetical protein